MANYVHDGDMPAELDFGASVAIASETMGLQTHRDRLCVVQLSAGDGDAHLVKLARTAGGAIAAPNLKRLLEDPGVEKILHFARFDVAAFLHWLGAATRPVYCTKIASKLARTYTDRHGLKDLARELLGVEMSKQQQSSDWGADVLTDAQIDYAASDVLYLHQMREKLDEMLAREGRRALAQACFDFLPARAALDVAGWPEIDIFAHS
ncbi:MAG: ribonuclease D [Parvularculaceae bacterium]